jgi:hypothetical protein
MHKYQHRNIRYMKKQGNMMSLRNHTHAKEPKGTKFTDILKNDSK